MESAEAYMYSYERTHTRKTSINGNWGNSLSYQERAEF